MIYLLAVYLESTVELYWQIPVEEKNLGPHDRLIHVYHFMKDPNQNQMVSLPLLLCNAVSDKE